LPVALVMRSARDIVVLSMLLMLLLSMEALLRSCYCMNTFCLLSVILECHCAYTYIFKVLQLKQRGSVEAGTANADDD
jgi:hypothetical protein